MNHDRTHMNSINTKVAQVQENKNLQTKQDLQTKQNLQTKQHLQEQNIKCNMQYHFIRRYHLHNICMHQQEAIGGTHMYQ